MLTFVERLALATQAQPPRESESESDNFAMPAVAGVDPDLQNVGLAKSLHKVDELLGEFYGTYPWPWQPTTFNYLDDPACEATMLNQDIGDWEHRTVSPQAAIWVAGCGTNQALQTALRFPNGTVMGSDVSVSSLGLARRNVARIGVANVELKQESINDVSYREQFDYVISTGVVHHNAEPRATLEKLAVSLKPGGILELMVYNRFHRMLTSSFQKAIRILSGPQGVLSFKSDFQLARALAAHFPFRNQLAELLEENRNVPDAEFADLFIHPVEHSYTVESLEALAASCGLEMLMPCISTYAKFRSPTIDWNLRFDIAELQSAYDALPDTRRWQVSNLLLHERSPLLWFYFRRSDGGPKRKSEQQICDEFLAHTFKKHSVKQRNYIRNDEQWALAPEPLRYPLEEPDPAVAEVYALADATNTMGRIFKFLGRATTFQEVNQVRIKLTTSAFPYLKAVKS